MENALTKTYLICAEEKASWFEFAQAIFDSFNTAELEVAKLTPIPTNDYKTTAQRPAFTVLNCNKASDGFNIKLPSWDEMLTLAVEGF